MLDEPLDFATMRRTMVSNQLRTAAVSDARVVAAMSLVPREAFLPAPLHRFAYRDTAQPLGGGRALNPPIATGRLLTAAAIVPADRVLLIGAATGYTAAVLAELARSVVAVECDPALAAAARDALSGYPGVTVIHGPLAAGAADEGPFDVLVVDGAVEALPDTLIAQLAPEGRIVAGVIDRGVTRLAVGARSGGGYGLQDFADVEAVELPGFARPRAFTF